MEQKKKFVENAIEGVNDECRELINFIQRRFQSLYIGNPTKERRTTEINLGFRGYTKQKIDRSNDIKLCNGDLTKLSLLKELSTYEYHELIEHIQDKK